MTEVLDSLILIETSEKIFIRPSVLVKGTKFMVINRISDEVTISADSNVIPSVGIMRSIAIGGMIGVINLVAGPYLIIIKTRTKVGELNVHIIWQMDEFEMIPFRKTNRHLSAKQEKYNSTYLDMLNTVLNTPSFYFSHTLDLSHNQQTLDLNSSEFSRLTLIDSADKKFSWNSHLLQMFSGRQDCQKFFVSIIHGFVSIKELIVNTKHFKLIIISRRSSKRPGKRLLSRGVDSDGNVSNFVETEQIVEYKGDITSFVQIRGSIPLFWTQSPNLRYKPQPTLSQTNQNEAFTKHFAQLRLKYGRIVCLNLINLQGSEAPLGTAFRNQVASSRLPDMRYEAFDFHQECGSTNWSRTEILMNKLATEIDQFGYFVRSREQGASNQEGVFRTNCIDCLDRTNVIQGLLARVNFYKVLKRMGILTVDENIASHPILDTLFKNVWADNGDFCSIEYSGTYALKSDFTRTGKRTFFGPLQDGYNSALRYLKNNFGDGFRQDAMNLFLGNYEVQEMRAGSISPLEKSRGWRYYTLPTWLIMSMAMCAAATIFPSEHSTKYIGILFCGSMAVTAGGMIIYYGTEFVDNPVLSAERRISNS